MVEVEILLEVTVDGQRYHARTACLVKHGDLVQRVVDHGVDRLKVYMQDIIPGGEED